MEQQTTDKERAVEAKFLDDKRKLGDNPAAGKAIAAVLLKKHQRDPKNFDLTKIAAATADYTGAEMDAVITEALFNGFGDNVREITTDDVVAAAASIIPLSKTAAEKIESIRKWGEGRARPASLAPQQKQQQSSRKLKI